MPEAIKKVFPKSIHRLCRWHVLINFMPLLNELYARFEKRNFKELFQLVINHPMTVTEFERAWEWMLGKFELHGDPTMQSLYETRKQWVPAYMKPLYCGTMVSTQRGESVNFIVKNAHVVPSTPMHQFAKQLVKYLHHEMMIEASATYHNTVRCRRDVDFWSCYHYCNKLL